MTASHEGVRVDPALLVALDALLTERSVTRAARRLGVTQSAVSHKLRALRESLGDPLLVAGRGGLVLTERAAAMAAPLRQALLDLRSATALGAGFDPARATRRFVISSSDYGELLSLPEVMRRVELEAPGVELQVDAPSPDLAERLADGRLDAAVAPALPMPGAIRRRKIWSEGFAVLVRPGHPVARQRWNLDRYLALRHLLIAPRGTRGAIVDDVLARQARSRRVALRVSSFVAATFVVARTDLCLTAPLGLARIAGRQLGLRELPVPLELPAVDTYLYWHARVDADPAHRWVRELVITTQDGLRAHISAPRPRRR